MRILDTTCGDGADLLQRVTERHGPALAAVARWPGRIFELRSPFADGFSFVGAEVDPQRLRPGSGLGNLHVGGTGVCAEDALAGCLGECAERLAQVEPAMQAFVQGPMRDLESELFPSARETIGLIVGLNGVGEAPLDWLRATPLQGSAEGLVPADWCLRRGGRARLAIPGAALSTGCAAGPSLEAAALSGLLELVERDAVAHWWIAGRPASPLAKDLLEEAEWWIGRVRGSCRARPTWVLDISTDLDVPCVAAVSVDAGGFGLACGFAARLSREAAIRSSVLELCQMELALALARAKLAQRGDAGLSPGDRRHIALASQIDAKECAPLHPRGEARRHGLLLREQAADPLRGLLEHLRGHGIEVAFLDLSRPELGVATAFAVAPALQMQPCGLVVPRLARAREAHAGAFGTHGVAIF